MLSWSRLVCLLCVIAAVKSRIHNLKLENDQRPLIDVTSFGIYKDGTLGLNMTVNLTFAEAVDSTRMMLTLKRKLTAQSRNFFNMGKQDDVKCIQNTENFTVDPDTLYFFFTNLATSDSMGVYIGYKLKGGIAVTTLGTENAADATQSAAAITTAATTAAEFTSAEAASSLAASSVNLSVAAVPPALPSGAEQSQKAQTPVSELVRHRRSESSSTQDTVSESKRLPVYVVRNSDDKMIRSFNTSFSIRVTNSSGEGLYDLSLYNCKPLSEMLPKRISVEISLIERNPGTYLSAGEIPLPYVYFAMAVLFFVSGSSYWFLICRSKEGVFKLHYLILAAVYCKGLALLFHGVNFYYIGLKGHRETAWAVIYYITYLMRSVVLFLTILLVGTGWSFIKHVFNDRDKKLFLIALPLQVLAYVARVIMDETEEGEENYTTWQRVVVVVDLLCCGAILFPVIWSIKHLTEASETDGKAAHNLAKLKIFRHYYLLVIAYIYITEIIIRIVELTEPFQYQWMSTLASEVATFLFVAITAYKFRPASNNPYFRVPDDEDDEEEVLTKSALLETVTRVVKIEDEDHKTSPFGGSIGTSGPKQREASHEYD